MLCILYQHTDALYYINSSTFRYYSKRTLKRTFKRAFSIYAIKHICCRLIWNEFCVYELFYGTHAKIILQLIGHIMIFGL